MNEELANDLLDLIKEYKKLANFIEYEVPLIYNESITGSLYLDSWLDNLANEVKISIKGADEE